MLMSSCSRLIGLCGWVLMCGWVLQSLEAATLASADLKPCDAPQQTATQAAASPAKIGKKNKKKSTRIGVVDFDRVSHEAAPFKEVSRVFNAKRDVFEEELVTLEKKLSRDEKELMPLRSSDPEKFKEAYAVFEKKLKDAHEKLDARKRTLRELYERHQGAAHARLNKAIETIAKKNRLDIVLASKFMAAPSVLYMRKSFDFTDAVIAELAKKE